MIQITPQMRILLAVEPVDFRKGIDGLGQVCRSLMATDPFSGSLFVFRNRRRTAIKILMYDGQGFWLFYKRLSAGKFRFWPRRADEAVTALAAHELQVLLCAGDPSGTQAAPARSTPRIAATAWTPRSAKIATRWPGPMPRAWRRAATAPLRWSNSR